MSDHAIVHDPANYGPQNKCMVGPTTVPVLARVLFSRGYQLVPGTQIRRWRREGYWHARVQDRETGQDMGERWIRHNGTGEGPTWMVTKEKP